MALVLGAVPSPGDMLLHWLWCLQAALTLLGADPLLFPSHCSALTIACAIQRGVHYPLCFQTKRTFVSILSQVVVHHLPLVCLWPMELNVALVEVFLFIAVVAAIAVAVAVAVAVAAL